MKKYKFPSNSKNFFINYVRGPYSEMHSHDYWEFTIITKGKIFHKINSFEHIVGENTLLVIRPNDNHSLNAVDNEDIAHINLGVKDEVMKNTLPTLSYDIYDFLLKSPYIEFEISKTATTYFINVFNKFQNTVHDKRASEEFLSLIFVSVIRELMLCVIDTRQKNNYSATVNEFIEYMRKKENLTLSIEDIIKKMNYSHCHIIRLFKKETGTTPSQYFLKIKLNYARSLLETTNMSVMDIASAVGFSSLGHFTEVFKKQYSLPPAKYRKNWNDYYDSFDEV